MNTNTKRRLTGGLMAMGAGLVLVSFTSEARADRVRVAASLSGIAFDVGPNHGSIAIGGDDACRDEPRRTWHEPVYEWRDVWVDVPAVIEERRVPEYGACGRRIGYRYVEVVIEPARRVLRTQRVLVREGYYDTVYQRTCNRGIGARLGVASGDRHVVISKRPGISHVRRVDGGPRVISVRHPARSPRRGLQVRLGP